MTSEITLDPEIRQKSILRRYMDLPKLLDLLYSSELYFRRADGFSDRLEGALFPSLRKSINEAYYEKRISYNADDFYRRSRVGNYVSCWTMGTRDNMSLWQLYGGVKNSIVVTTTVARLIKCAFHWNRQTHLYKVKYVDHRRVKNYIIGSYSDVLQYKSDAYKYEKELRIVIPKQDNNWESNPIDLRIKLPKIDTLVSSIVVSPEADEAFFNAIIDLCKRYGLKAPVKRSKLSFVKT